MLVSNRHRCFSVFALVFLCASATSAREPWRTFENCRYLSNAANDGDSFHVRVADKEYIFRLYFVDTPETDTSIPDRLTQQATYFHLDDRQALQLGREAERFTRQKLSQPFTVRTCLQDARGRSRLPRYFAFVQIGSTDLGESLVANGLARVYGAASDVPGMDRAEVEWRKLERLEGSAKEQRIGGWGLQTGRLNQRAASQPTHQPNSFDAFFHPARQGARRSAGDTLSGSDLQLDINSATMGALQDVPGIGPVLAGRIIEARPFETTDDLRNVKGIGQKTYEKLRPYFR